SATGVPTGTVNLRDGATVIATGTLDANGHASFITSKLTQGTHTITAAYNGDVNYIAATSAGVQQNVQLAQPMLTLSGPASTVDAGTNAQFVSTLTTPGTTPTGTLTLRDGSTPIATLPVSSNGNFTFNTNLLSIGTHTLTAVYGGDTDNAAATSTAINVTIRQANSATTLVSNANPLTQGNALSLTATVTSDSPNAGGQMNFYDGSSLLGSAALNANGSASFSATNLTLGTHVLTAIYAGDTNHAGSTSSPLSELVVQGSAATLNSSNNPSASGQNVTFTAQIYAAKGTSTTAATGTVSFRDNGTLLAAVPLNGSGAASFATDALTVGTHTITVTYAGDTNYAATGAQLTQTVTESSTQVALSASANPGTYGQPLSLSATVTSNGGLPTGEVNFTDGKANLGSAQLNGNGIAVFTLTTLSPGAHTIVASYVGDGKASPSASSPLALVVKQATALVVSSSSNPVQTLSSVSLTVTLKNAGAVPATGTITFSDGTTTIGTATLDSTGHATLTLPQMTAGNHSITANYVGDGADFGSASPVFTETVQLRPTTTTVTGSLTDSANPQQVTLIAVVKGQGSTAPTGTVTFTSGSVTLGVAAVDETGVATITVIFETKTEPVIGSYAGDISYTSSTSASTPITAGQAAQFTLAVNVPSITLATHQHTTVNVNLGSVKGFTDMIELGCEGLPYAATCTFSQSQLKLAPDGTATASLILDTGDPLGAGSGTTASLKRVHNTLLCWLPVGLLLGLVQRKRTRAVRRKLGTLIVLAFAFVLTMGTMGCSGLSTSGTPAGTYSFKVIGTGMGSGTTQAQSVTLVVTQ
ncbi:MAG: beta strand repeat-containing protein, partial [Janthinobacterium lividum]